MYASVNSYLGNHFPYSHLMSYGHSRYPSLGTRVVHTFLEVAIDVMRPEGIMEISCKPSVAQLKMSTKNKI